MVCTARSLPSIRFDERLQTRESFVPLLGDAVEVIPDLFDRLWVELKQTFTPRTNTAHHAHALKNPKVFRDRLSSQVRPFRKLRDRISLPATEFREQR